MSSARRGCAGVSLAGASCSPTPFVSYARTSEPSYRSKASRASWACRRRVSLRRDQDAAFLDVRLVGPGVLLGDARPDQRADQAARHGTDGRAAERRGQGPSRHDRPDARGSPSAPMPTSQPASAAREAARGTRRPSLRSVSAPAMSERSTIGWVPRVSFATTETWSGVKPASFSAFSACSASRWLFEDAGHGVAGRASRRRSDLPSSCVFSLSCDAAPAAIEALADLFAQVLPGLAAGVGAPQARARRPRSRGRCSARRRRPRSRAGSSARRRRRCGCRPPCPAWRAACRSAARSRRGHAASSRRRRPARLRTVSLMVWRSVSTSRSTTTSPVTTASLRDDRLLAAHRHPDRALLEGGRRSHRPRPAGPSRRPD